ncbi:6383_t:CDS:2 [Entrophospora sp. SA101]|nr:6383_t:CDS:2 [Entrophospora sp. SA101]
MPAPGLYLNLSYFQSTFPAWSPQLSLRFSSDTTATFTLMGKLPSPLNSPQPPIFGGLKYETFKPFEY